ncbi:MAG: hypothetical protein KDB53_22035 [Planctomycetes bacterium]|nr:hypothetical protein [Planctomycetota bacterium]
MTSLATHRWSQVWPGGLVALAGLGVLLWREPSLTRDPPPPRATAPLTSRVLIVEATSVPEAAFDDPRTLPFFQSLAGFAQAPLQTEPATAPVEDLAGRLAAAGLEFKSRSFVVDDPESIARREALKSSQIDVLHARLATHQSLIDGPLVDDLGNATSTALAFHALDLEAERIAAALGGRTTRMLCYGQPGRGGRWAAAGAGIAPHGARHRQGLSISQIESLVCQLLGLRPLAGADGNLDFLDGLTAEEQASQSALARQAADWAEDRISAEARAERKRAWRELGSFLLVFCGLWWGYWRAAPELEIR